MKATRRMAAAIALLFGAGITVVGCEFHEGDFFIKADAEEQVQTEEA
jgi:hypothetical protein